MAQRQTLAERMASKIAINAATGCHDWVGARNYGGYGLVTIKKRNCLAHREMYRLVAGEIGEGLEICHRCDNPACVNPEHLFAGTHAENMRDKAAKKRASRLPGSKNGRAKLTESQVAAIKAAVGRTRTELSREYGVSIAQISDICLGQKWSHVEAARG